MRRAIGAAARPMGELGAVLDAVVGDRRIVVLGESHHFVRETYALRAAVLDHLGRRGWRVLGTEIAFGDGCLVDAYLGGAPAGVLDGVGTFGHRTVASRRPSGALAETLAAFPAAAFRAETTRVLDRLRGADPPWRHVGLDVDYDPAVAAEQLAGLTGAARAHLERTLPAGRRYDDAVHRAPDLAALREPMAWREELMAGNARYAVELAAGGKVVLCGHNLHVGPGADRIEIPGGVGPGGGLVPPLGRVLADAYPGEIACVWMLHDRGEDGGPPPGGGRIRSARGTLNAALARAGDAFVLPTAGLDGPWRIATMYGAEVTGVPADLCDAILFHAEATPI